MYRTRIALVAFSALLATPTIASADYRGYGGSVDRRQANQEQRIQQGARSGEITRFERQRLEAEQARIRQLERHAKSDGYVSPAERARLNAAQNAASRHIYQEKHDDQSRRHYRPWWRR